MEGRALSLRRCYHDGPDDDRRRRREGRARRHRDSAGSGWRGAHQLGPARVLVRRKPVRDPHGTGTAAASGTRPVTGRRAGIIVLDGVGIGAAPTTAAYGDAGSDTLGNVARAVGGLSLPNLERLGLGLCRPIKGLGRPPKPEAAYGVALPASAGKDSTTGHWEICGVLLE